MADTVSDERTMRPSETLDEARKRLGKLGLRPVVQVVPDPNAPGYQDEIDRQCRAVSGSTDEQGIMEFIEEALAETLADEPPYGDDK